MAISVPALLLGASAVLCAVLVTVICSTTLGGWGIKYFTWHPVLFVLAVVLLAPAAATAYQWDGPTWPWHRRRLLHAGVGAVTLCCTAGGWYVVWRHHEDEGDSHIAAGKALIRQVHVWAGYATLLLIVAQTCGGAVKLYSRLIRNAGAVPWHARLSRVTLPAGYLTVALGLGIRLHLALTLVLSAGLGLVYVVSQLNRSQLQAAAHRYVPGWAAGIELVEVAQQEEEEAEDDTQVEQPRATLAGPAAAGGEDGGSRPASPKGLNTRSTVHGVLQ